MTHRTPDIVNAFQKICMDYLDSSRAYYQENCPVTYGTKIEIVGFKDGKKVHIQTDSNAIVRHCDALDNLIVSQVAEQVKDLYICFE